MKLTFYGEPQYIIDEEKGTVTCILECGFTATLLHTMRKYGFIYTGDLPPYWIVKGIARLHPDDTFDKTIGCRIAESKAKQKAYKKGANLLSLIIKRFDKLSTKLVDTIHFLSEKESFEIEHYNKLIV